MQSREWEENADGEAEVGAGGGLPLLSGDPHRRSQSRTRGRPQGAGAGQQAGAERGAADSGRGSRATRGDLPAVGGPREDPRRRAVAALRGGAAAGARRADHQAHARLRSRLTAATSRTWAATSIGG